MTLLSVLGRLHDAGSPVFDTYLQTVAFAQGDCIFREDTVADGCYLIDAGEVRLEIECAETDTDPVLSYLEPGMFLGELSLLDSQPRSASAYAHTDVVTRWLSNTALATLCMHHPDIGVSILQALGRDVAGKVRLATERMAEYLNNDDVDTEVDAMVARAVKAQKAFTGWSEARVDALLYDLAETVAERAENLAAATVAETGIGNVPDKTIKNRFASREIYRSLAGKPGIGLLRIDKERRVAEIGSPVGVVLGLIPMTNPVATMIFKILIALKGRNALILSCHRNALEVAHQVDELIADVLRRHEAPADLVQWIRQRASRKKMMMFMQHKDVGFILATGGAGVVKAAYSSGTPALGVGSGNAPAWICADADLQTAARLVVQSKSFDNGVICGSEQHLVVDASVRQAFVAALEAEGAAVLRPDEAEHFSTRAFDPRDGRLRWDLLGQSAQSIAGALDIRRAGQIRLIVVPVGRDALTGPQGREKLAPVLSLFTAGDIEDGMSLCMQLLANGGVGHTAIIHTRSTELVAQFGAEIAASRILVNAPGAQGCIGIGTGLVPSLTLGCGTFGGMSTTDNVSYTHLLNIKRVAHYTDSVQVAYVE